MIGPLRSWLMKSCEKQPRRNATPWRCWNPPSTLRPGSTERDVPTSVRRGSQCAKKKGSSRRAGGAAYFPGHHQCAVARTCRAPSQQEFDSWCCVSKQELTFLGIKSPIFKQSRLFLTAVDHLRWGNRRASSF